MLKAGYQKIRVRRYGNSTRNSARRSRIWDAMRDRLREFSLSLHPDKTRLIEFGRFGGAELQEAADAPNRKPSSFLGFVLICDKSRRGGLSDQKEVTSGPACMRKLRGR